MTQPQLQPLLRVENLTVDFPTVHGDVAIVDDVSFEVPRAKVLSIVGESGSGKSVTALSLLGLIRSRNGRIRSGSVTFEGRNLVTASERELSDIRGARIGMIFQQPTRCLNPAFKIGDQLVETIRRHEAITRRDARDRVISLLDRVGIANAAVAAQKYPHQWSGGMCQRAMIAQALACGPSLLIADEPTTALDVTVQSTILSLLEEIREETGIAILLITHDFGVVAEIADSVAVMYAGQIIEQASAESILTAPTHPYTRALIDAVPSAGVTSLTAIAGNAASPADRIDGCRFAPRCCYAEQRCWGDTIPMDVDERDGHESRCVRVRELRQVLAR